MLKTLAAKHRSTVSKMAAKYKAKVKTRNGPRSRFEARKHRQGKEDLVARSGGIILQRDRHAEIRDTPARPGCLPPQGADIQAPQTGVRTLRDRDHGGSPPGHWPQSARASGTGPARVGRPHGEKAAQDPHRLRDCHDWIHATPVTHAA